MVRVREKWTQRLPGGPAQVRVPAVRKRQRNNHTGGQSAAVPLREGQRWAGYSAAEGASAGKLSGRTAEGDCYVLEGIAIGVGRYVHEGNGDKLNTQIDLFVVR